jgi:hypothetical protein
MWLYFTYILSGTLIYEPIIMNNYGDYEGAYHSENKRRPQRLIKVT